MLIGKRGFTLVNALVGLSLSAVMAMSLLKLTDNMALIERRSKRVDHASSIRTISNLISNSEKHCTASFGVTPGVTPIVFEKVLVDSVTQGESGVPVTLWLSNQDGSQRLTERLAPANSDSTDSTAVSNQINNSIQSISLYFLNGSGFNYDESALHSDLATLQIVIKDGENREKIIKKEIALDLQTDTSGLTKIIRCSSTNFSSDLAEDTTVTPAGMNICYAASAHRWSRSGCYKGFRPTGTIKATQTNWDGMSNVCCATGASMSNATLDEIKTELLHLNSIGSFEGFRNDGAYPSSHGFGLAGGNLAGQIALLGVPYQTLVEACYANPGRFGTGHVVCPMTYERITLPTP